MDNSAEIRLHFCFSCNGICRHQRRSLVEDDPGLGTCKYHFNEDQDFYGNKNGFNCNTMGLNNSKKDYKQFNAEQLQQCTDCMHCFVHQKLDAKCSCCETSQTSIFGEPAKQTEIDSHNVNMTDNHNTVRCTLQSCCSNPLHIDMNNNNTGSILQYSNSDSNEQFNSDKTVNLCTGNHQLSASSDYCITRPIATVTAVLKVLRLAIFLFIMEGIVTIEGQMTGYNYRSVLARTSCQSNDGCRSTIGEVCWWAWDGCGSGECMCDPRTSFHDASLGFCRPLKYGGERCEPGDKCWQGMTCTDGFCRCDKGTMTSDKMFCLLHNEKLLGQRCTDKDTCFQRAKHGYTKSETHCGENGRCRCDDGFKEDGWTCRKWNVNEPGCSKDHHCQGGALCVDSVCRCPSTYIPVARDSKCAKEGARHDLQLREYCDEVNENRYCAYSLVCHKCAGAKRHTCVKFIEAEALPYRFSSSTSIYRSTHTTLVLSTLVCIITWITS